MYSCNRSIIFRDQWAQANKRAPHGRMACAALCRQPSPLLSLPRAYTRTVWRSDEQGS